MTGERERVREREREKGREGQSPEDRLGWRKALAGSERASQGPYTKDFCLEVSGENPNRTFISFPGCSLMVFTDWFMQGIISQRR